MQRTMLKASWVVALEVVATGATALPAHGMVVKLSRGSSLQLALEDGTPLQPGLDRQECWAKSICSNQNWGAAKVMRPHASL